MKYTKILILLLLPFLIECISSCCHCTDSVIKKYTNKNITLINLDNTGASPFETDADSIMKTGYAMRFKLERELYAYKGISLFPSACAFRCGCPPKTIYKPQDSITSFKVITSNDFDSTHKAGDDISSYFHIYENHKYLATDEFLNKYNTAFTIEQEFNLEVDFLLMTAPALGFSHRFKLILNLSDGRNLEFTPKTIILY